LSAGRGTGQFFETEGAVLDAAGFRGACLFDASAAVHAAGLADARICGAQTVLLAAHAARARIGGATALLGAANLSDTSFGHACADIRAALTPHADVGDAGIRFRAATAADTEVSFACAGICTAGIARSGVAFRLRRFRPARTTAPIDILIAWVLGRRIRPAWRRALGRFAHPLQRLSRRIDRGISDRRSRRIGLSKRALQRQIPSRVIRIGQRLIHRWAI
jgi:hypothetical protein